MLAKLNPLAVFCRLPFALTPPGLFQPSRNVCPDWTRNRILLGSFRAGDLLEFSKLQGDGVEVDTVLFFFSLFLLGFLKWNAWKTWGRKPSQSNNREICNTWWAGRGCVYSCKVERGTVALCWFSRGIISKTSLPLCPKPVYKSLFLPWNLPQVVKYE